MTFIGQGYTKPKPKRGLRAGDEITPQYSNVSSSKTELSLVIQGSNLKMYLVLVNKIIAIWQDSQITFIMLN